ncbi:class I SAM-dependent methyltransferase [Dactylosporangium sp. CA-139114]|uniref:class I SAM-dependent methyltransferase n=1 Tax=Dactylosporangium sp. CA-139114 TaxID=3239931 RepID=UPI003D990748
MISDCPRLDADVDVESVEDHPDLYDWTYEDYTEDLGYWSSIVGRERALELGVGSGRVALPLAAFGARIIGLDRSPNMLRALAQRSIENDLRVSTVCASMHAIPLASTSLELIICPFGALNYCLTQAEVRSVLREVRRVLRPGGRFVFEALAWSTWPAWLANDGRDHLVKSRTKDGSTTSMSCQYSFDAASGLAVQLRRYRRQDETGGVRVRTVRWVNRFVAPSEWRLLLEAAGLTIEAEYGDYDGGPYRHASEFYLVESRRG